MCKIFYIMGKSSSGKDTMFENLLEREDLCLQKIVPYTTRPIRTNEIEGEQYHFVTEETLQNLLDEGCVIELREYQVVGGVWKYFTVDDGQVRQNGKNYLAIGTLESFCRMKEYYGDERVVPVYMEVSDDHRLERALKREREQELPNYDELCRRFLADSTDFCEENLQKAGISRRFRNDGDRGECMEEIAAFIKAESERA